MTQGGADGEPVICRPGKARGGGPCLFAFKSRREDEPKTVLEHGKAKSTRYRLERELVSVPRLDFLDVAEHAGADVGGVAFVGVDVHGEAEGRVLRTTTSPKMSSRSPSTHPHDVVVAHAKAPGVFRRHVDVALGADHATFDGGRCRPGLRG